MPRSATLGFSVCARHEAAEPRSVRCVLILSFAAVAAGAGEDTTKFRITEHSAGDTKIGTPANQLYNQFPPERVRLVDLRLEGELSPALEIQPHGTSRGDAVVAELACRQSLVIWRITINDPAFTTPRGIHVGSTVADLRKAHGTGHLIAGEGSIGIRVDELQVTLVVSVPNAPDSWYHTTDASLVPGATVIRAILLN